MSVRSEPLVIDNTGSRGTLLSTQSASSEGGGFVTILLEDGRQIQIPREALRPQDDGNYYVPLTLRETTSAGTSGASRPEEVLRVPVIEETLSVEKKAVETGRTRIHKTVREREEIIHEPLMREEIIVERVSVNRPWDGTPVSIRYEGDTMIIPLLEEVLVVEKRMMLTEEVHVRRKQTVVQEPRSVTLRREEVTVERIPAPDTDPVSVDASTSTGVIGESSRQDA